MDLPMHSRNGDIRRLERRKLTEKELAEEEQEYRGLVSNTSRQCGPKSFRVLTGLMTPADGNTSEA